jgi:hypothetical protein
MKLLQWQVLFQRVLIKVLKERSVLMVRRVLLNLQVQD